MIATSKLFINGRSVDAISRKVMPIISPLTESLMKEVVSDYKRDDAMQFHLR